MRLISRTTKFITPTRDISSGVALGRLDSDGRSPLTDPYRSRSSDT